MIFYTKSGGRKRKSFLSPLFAVLLWVVSQPPILLTQSNPMKSFTLAGEGIMVSTNNNTKNTQIIDGIINISPISHNLLGIKQKNTYALTSEFHSGKSIYKLDLKSIQSLNEIQSHPVAYASMQNPVKGKSVFFQGWATLSKNSIVVTKMAPVLFEIISTEKQNVLIINVEEPSNTNHVIVLETEKTN